MKLSYKRTVFVGLAFFAITMFWQVYDNLVPVILKETFSLKHAVIGIVMALDNVLALFLLPLFGALSDRTKTRWGKRTPYIVCGTVLAAMTFVFAGLMAVKSNFIGFLVTLGLVLVFMGTYRSPAVALMPDVTVKPLRSRANAVINLMGAVGGLISLGLIALLLSDARTEYLTIFSVVAGIMIVSLVVFLIFVREPKFAKEMEEYQKQLGIEEETVSTEKEIGGLEKNKWKSMLFLLASVFLWYMSYNAVTSMFANYASSVWNVGGGEFTMPLMVAQAAAIASYIPVGLLAARIGRRKCILIGVACMVGSFVAAFFFGTNLFIKIDLSGGVYNNPMFYVMCIFFALCGVGWATINVNSYPMVVEMSRGANVGRFTGYYYTASMAAQIVTPVLAGVFMDIDERTLFVYATVFVALALVTMLFVRHGDVKPLAPKSKLESFDVED